jgi:Arc/MetJ family transcription regulator
MYGRTAVRDAMRSLLKSRGTLRTMQERLDSEF